MIFALSALTAVVLGSVHGAHSEWSPVEQAGVENPSSVSVSPDGTWVAYVVSTVEGAVPGKLAPSGSLVLQETSPGAPRPDPRAAFVASACVGGVCSAPTFAADGSLVFLKGGGIYRSTLAATVAGSTGGGTSWTAPARLQHDAWGTAPIIAYAVSPDARSVAVTYAEMGTYSNTEGRVITTDVIVNVITGTRPMPIARLT